MASYTKYKNFIKTRRQPTYTAEKGKLPKRMTTKKNSGAGAAMRWAAMRWDKVMIDFSNTK